MLFTFFSTLFNLRLRNKLQGTDEGSCANMDDENGNADIYQTDIDKRIESFLEDQNFTKIHSMFQMLFYFVHRGQKKTPLTVMTGHTVYDKCKSRELITALNKIGVSTSYNEVLKNRKKLADYVLASSVNEGPPFPSHFSKDHFSICAFDNFDHADRSSLSGTHSGNDTAIVMFQVKPDIIP